jgi:hypothetical protein
MPPRLAQYGPMPATNIDNSSVSSLDHVRCEGLRNEKGAAEVRVQHEIPVAPRNVYRGFANIAACIIDEDVDRSEMLDGARSYGADAGFIAYVEFQREDASP